MKTIRLLPIILVISLIFAGCQKEPSANFSASKTVVEIGETITFTNATTDGYDYEWDFGDGITSTDENPSHSYSQAGTFTVKMTAFSKNGKKEDETTTTITVNSKPTTCYITSIKFTSYLQDDNGYYWDNAAAGYYPDIYFLFADEGGNTIYNATSSNRIENVTSAPFSWNFTSPGLTFDMNKTFYVHLYDYDSLDSDDHMGGCGGNTLNNYNNYPYPSTITLSCSNMTVELSVTWI